MYDVFLTLRKATSLAIVDLKHTAKVSEETLFYKDNPKHVTRINLGVTSLVVNEAPLEICHDGRTPKWMQYSKINGVYENSLWKVPNVGDVVIFQDYTSDSFEPLPKALKTIAPEAVFGGQDISLGILKNYLCILSYYPSSLGIKLTTLPINVEEDGDQSDILKRIYQRGPYAHTCYLSNYTVSTIKYGVWLGIADVSKYYSVDTGLGLNDIDLNIQYIIEDPLSPQGLTDLGFNYLGEFYSHPSGVRIELVPAPVDMEFQKDLERTWSCYRVPEYYPKTECHYIATVPGEDPTRVYSLRDVEQLIF